MLQGSYAIGTAKQNNTIQCNTNNVKLCVVEPVRNSDQSNQSNQTNQKNNSIEKVLANYYSQMKDKNNTGDTDNTDNNNNNDNNDNSKKSDDQLQLLSYEEVQNQISGKKNKSKSKKSGLLEKAKSLLIGENKSGLLDIGDAYNEGDRVGLLSDVIE
ncbi:hypothetical protein ECANGB1_586 [Enterospora canceri]|uniref:Uncharacterized protein n=1 Tax=Enterospora canceri TaxID=1081671 RepID=A0A1Y1S7R8_9MICR|nr:hypothetical protein ECANGB1_586 [Enterospora canceri]